MHINTLFESAAVAQIMAANRHRCTIYEAPMQLRVHTVRRTRTAASAAENGPHLSHKRDLSFYSSKTIFFIEPAPFSFLTNKTFSQKTCAKKIEVRGV